MLLKLSKNAFVRQYGEFTYVLERIKCYDQMFNDAEVFMRWITRTPMEKTEILKNICDVFTGADADEIAHDFDEFIAPLIKEKVILADETAAELDAQEVSFSYDVEHPKTMDTHYIKPSTLQSAAARSFMARQLARNWCEAARYLRMSREGTAGGSGVPEPRPW